MRALAMPAFRAGLLFLAAGTGTLMSNVPAYAEEAHPGDADMARQLVEEVAAKSGGETLDAWSRTVIDRALERAATTGAGPVSGGAGTTPLPEFNRVVGGAGSMGPGTAEVLLFTSLSVPAASWRAAARDAARIGAPLVLRGVTKESLPVTAGQIAGRLGDAQVGIAIDPRLFRLFGIARVPAVVVVPGGVPRCRSRGCADDPPPPFDRVSGNLSLAASLEAIAAEGDAGRAVARRHLAILRGTGQ